MTYEERVNDCISWIYTGELSSEVAIKIIDLLHEAININKKNQIETCIGSVSSSLGENIGEIRLIINNNAVID